MLPDLEILEEKAKKLRKQINTKLAESNESNGTSELTKQAETVKEMLKELEKLKKKPKEMSSVTQLGENPIKS